MVNCDNACAHVNEVSAEVLSRSSFNVGGVIDNASVRVMLPLTILTYEACDTEAGSKCVVCNSRATKLNADIAVQPPLLALNTVRISYELLRPFHVMLKRPDPPVAKWAYLLMQKIWPTIPVDQIFVNFITYQDDLMTPGSSPRCAISRRRTREIPNFCRVPRGRPSMESRLRTRTGEASRGSFCKPTRASSCCSSVEFGSISCAFSCLRRSS